MCPHWAKCAGTLNQNPKILKKFSDSLTPYFTTTYAFHYPLYAICYPLFFVPNAQVHPIVERRCFSAPSDIVLDLGVLFWTFKFEKFEFVPAATSAARRVGFRNSGLVLTLL
jgi:hypothetical protein